MARLLRFVTFVLANTLAGSVFGQWSVIVPQTSQQDDGQQPSIRYGHGMVAIAGNLYLTHGYYHDDVYSGPSWKADTWKVNISTGAVTRLHAGISSHEAYNLQQHDQSPIAPSGRYGISVVEMRGSLWMYGGDDGGYSQHGSSHYKFGYYFTELWEFDLGHNVWKLHNLSAPGQRHLHAATASHRYMYLHGGMLADAEIWRLDVETMAWDQLTTPQTSSCAHGGPGHVHGHQIDITYINGHDALIMFGGLTRCDQADQLVLSNKMWLYRTETSSWTHLRPAQADMPLPSPRSYFSFNLQHFVDSSTPPPCGRKGVNKAKSNQDLSKVVPEGWASKLEWPLRVLCGDTPCVPAASWSGLLVAGTPTTPGLTCNPEVWRFTVHPEADTVSWTMLDTQIPVPIFEHAGAEYQGRVYTHGGHLCSNKLPGYPWHYTNVVLEYKDEFVGQ